MVHPTKSVACTTVIIGAILMVVLILHSASTKYFSKYHTDEDITDIKKLIDNIDAKLQTIELDAIRLVEIFDNFHLDHNQLLAAVDGELDRLRNAQQSFDRQMRKMNLRLEAVVSEQEKHDSIIWSVGNSLMLLVCMFIKAVLPKSLTMEFCAFCSDDPWYVFD